MDSTECPPRIALVVNWGFGHAVCQWFAQQVQFPLEVVCIHSRNTESSDPFESLVYQYAQAHFKHVYPLKKPLELAEDLRRHNVDWVIMHAYPYILPSAIVQEFHPKWINLHPSLLPKYRGRNPATEVLVNREAYTGITAVEVGTGIDDGPIYEQITLKIEEHWSRTDLLDAFTPLAAELMPKLFAKLLAGFVPICQSEQS